MALPGVVFDGGPDTTTADPPPDQFSDLNPPVPPQPPQEAPPAPPPTPSGPSAEFAAFLRGIYPGIPQEVIDAAWGVARSNGWPEAGSHVFVLGFIRNSDWHKGTYRGYQEGASKGLWSNEAEYGAWLTGINRAFRKFHNRDATHAEIDDAIRNGDNESTLTDRFSGGGRGPSAAEVDGLPSAVKGLFSQAELNSMKSGSIEGQRLWDLAQKALQFLPVFQLANRTLTRADLDSLNAAGTTPDQLQQELITGPAATGVLPTAITGIFTPQELLEMQRGTAQGQILLDFARWVESVIPVYARWNRPLPTRSELEAAWRAGDTPDLIDERITEAGILAATPAAAGSIFSAPELKQIAEGTNQTLVNMYRLWQGLVPIYSRYGKALSRELLEGHYQRGDTPELIGSQFQEEQQIQVQQAGIAAQRPDLNYTLGAFGPGQLTPEDEQELARSRAGLPSERGAFLESELQKAQQRLTSVFQGVLANFERRGLGMLLSPPDIAR